MTEYDETSDAESPSGSALLKMGTWLRRGTTSPDTRQLFLEGGRDADVFYRKCWSHDKVVRSTHGVNCTGSCSWKIYVKEGIITWESQQTDYPSTGPDMPDYEPRGCPRGASFSWYEYSPHEYVTPMCAQSCLTRGETNSPNSAIQWTLGHPSPTTQSSPRHTSAPAGTEAWCVSHGRKPPRSSRQPTCTPSRPTVPTASPGSLSSRPCQWCPTEPAPGSLNYSVALC